MVVNYPVNPVFHNIQRPKIGDNGTETVLAGRTTGNIAKLPETIGQLIPRFEGLLSFRHGKKTDLVYVKLIA
ncbi:MAG: hypothetical protein GY780_00970 [bacterium]|nr:hypothetical protein [bacterium]